MWESTSQEVPKVLFFLLFFYSWKKAYTEPLLSDIHLAKTKSQIMEENVFFCYILLSLNCLNRQINADLPT